MSERRPEDPRRELLVPRALQFTLVCPHFRADAPSGIPRTASRGLPDQILSDSLNP